MLDLVSWRYPGDPGDTSLSSGPRGAGQKSFLRPYLLRAGPVGSQVMCMPLPLTCQLGLAQGVGMRVSLNECQSDAKGSTDTKG